MNDYVSLHLGDCLDVLRAMPAESVDALVTDPPAGIRFMNRLWDTDHGGRKGWCMAFEVIFRECLRVMKPGAHGLVWALPRTSHWTATALEDAGFEVRDSITHHFGSGFPKSLDVSKAIDKAAGAEREVVGSKIGVPGYSLAPNKGHLYGGGFGGDPASDPVREAEISAPATEAAKQWQGWGTALKPATEVWWLVRKPLDSPNVASNVLKHGTGALNVDGCRVAGVSWTRPGGELAGRQAGLMGKIVPRGPSESNTAGRWPANLVLTHSERCRPVGVRKVGSGDRVIGGKPRSNVGFKLSESSADRSEATVNYGTETIPAWDCATDGSCPVYELDRQSGESTSRGGGRHNGDKFGGGYAPPGKDDIGFGDFGGASRFFPTFRYEPKASTAERNQGLSQSYLNRHPTVKPVELMRWLCRLVTPSGGIVLDPFMGSGSTGVAARLEGFRFIGIEKDAESYETARRRLEWAVHEPGLFDEEEVTR